MCVYVKEVEDPQRKNLVCTSHKRNERRRALIYKQHWRCSIHVALNDFARFVPILPPTAMIAKIYIHILLLNIPPPEEEEKEEGQMQMQILIFYCFFIGNRFLFLVDPFPDSKFLTLLSLFSFVKHLKKKGVKIWLSREKKNVKKLSITITNRWTKIQQGRIV